MRRLLSLAVISLLLLTPVLASAGDTGVNATQIDFLGKVLSNPRTYIVVIVQFLLGLALGYFSLKALKYIVALILVVVLGMVLSVWSIGGDIYDLLANIYGSSSQLIHVVESLASTLGLLALGPTTVGFIIGAILAWIKS